MTTVSSTAPRRPAPNPSLAAGLLVTRMELVEQYRAALLRLQGAWDMLALLGPMSGIGTEIGQTRDAFHHLTDTLVASLARQLLQQRLQGLRGKAQVTIDILVRNLFERTADVGFLATDAPLRDFVQAAADGTAEDGQRRALQARFAAYVAKYSVYDDIVVVAADGRVLVRLDDSVTADTSHDSLLAASLRPGVPYVERFGQTDILGGRRGLIYSAGIADAQGRPAAVLCLSFRFEDEMRGVFAHLLDDSDDGTVLALLDADGRVLVSADAWQFPVGAPLPPATPSGSLLRFGGREYLSVGAHSAGYQGYGGPGWQAVALIPVDFAFRAKGDATGGQAGETGDGDLAALARGIDTRDIFDAELRAIPNQARQIQRELARSVWNGKLAPADVGGTASSSAFTGTFLQEVSRTGTQIRGVFDDAISRLQTGGISSVLEQARFQARLAIDILDRNLYERANDCRWWALTPALREALAAPEPALLERAGQVLQHINGLYTVYTLLVLFDAQGRIVAVSDPARAELLGTQADPATVQATLGLRDPARHRVGPHAPSALYGGLPTYVYAAGVQAAGGAVLGGVAIVFDGAPQFSAMLSDALPRTPAGEPISGAIGLFVARNGSVLASTDPRVPAGSRLPLAASLPDLPRGSAGQRVVEWEGVHYAAGVSQGGGYREYRQGDPASPHDVAAIVLLRLGEALPLEKSIPTTFESTPRSGKASGSVTEIAGFTLGAQWFGLEATAVEEVIGPVTPVALPNAPGHVAGLVRHRGEVVPVIDPGMVLATGPAALDGPLLICRADHGQRIALRVDSLGTVFTVDAVQLVPWQPPAGGRKLRLLSGRSAGGSSMLTLLPVEALWSSGVSLPNFSGLDLGPESESESEFAPEPEPEPKPARRELRQTETIR